MVAACGQHEFWPLAEGGISRRRKDHYMNRPIRSAGRRLALGAALLFTAGTMVAGLGTAVTQSANAAMARATQARTASAQTPSSTVKAVRTVNGRVIQVITCNAHVLTPHFLLPNHRSIVLGGTTHCSATVSAIRLRLTLIKDGRPFKSKIVNKRNVDKALDFLTYRCPTNRAHSYQGELTGSITFPPGFVPHQVIIGPLLSPVVHLICRR
jgi:hypothetical protein